MELKDFLDSINQSKKEIPDENDLFEKDYTPFVVNKCLSYFNETIFHANEMNCLPGLYKKAQFDYYRLSLKKRKRFSPWLKKEKDADLKAVQKAFGYNETKAREALNILSDEDLVKIHKSLDTGGVRK